MGLDMYLMAGAPDSCFGREIELGYWRKANAIHNWFVENVQNDVDDCDEYPVSREQLQALLDTVNIVLSGSELVDDVDGCSSWDADKIIKNSSVAELHLPTRSGFFFGSIDYDQWYYEDLEHTKKVLEAALANNNIDKFYYHSSW